MRKSNQELATTDIFVLSDDDLKAHINDLQDERNQLKQSVVPSVGECNTLIALAQSELASRASDRTARQAFWSSMIAIGIAVAGILADLYNN
jgi:uncharacterized small protein (DUF1192 family)